MIYAGSYCAANKVGWTERVAQAIPALIELTLLVVGILGLARVGGLQRVGLACTVAGGSLIALDILLPLIFNKKMSYPDLDLIITKISSHINYITVSPDQQSVMIQGAKRTIPLLPLTYSRGYSIVPASRGSSYYLYYSSERICETTYVDGCPIRTIQNVFLRGCPEAIFEQALIKTELSWKEKRALKEWRREPEQVHAIASVQAMIAGNYPLVKIS